MKKINNYSAQYKIISEQSAQLHTQNQNQNHTKNTIKKHSKAGFA